jgi:cytochrome c-type biogenesis protein CcmH/NrfG
MARNAAYSCPGSPNPEGSEGSYAEAIVTNNPRSDAAWLKLGETGGTVGGEYHSRDACYRRVLQLRSCPARAAEAAAQRRAADGRKVAAAERAVASDPAGDGAWLKLGETGGTVAGKFYSRQACYERVLELRGRTVVRSATPAEAIAAAELAVANDPSSDVAWLKLGETGGAVHGVRHDRAACYERVLRLRGYTVSNPEAVASQRKAEAERNAAAAGRAVAQDPSSDAAWLKLGETGGAVNGVEFSRAACYERVLELRGYTVDTLALVAQHSVTPAENVAAAELAVANDPSSDVAWLKLGETGGVVDGAEYTRAACYERVLELRGCSAEALAVIGSAAGTEPYGTKVAFGGRDEMTAWLQLGGSGVSPSNNL